MTSEMVRTFKRGAALYTDERPVLRVRQFMPLEQTVPLERLAALLTYELPLFAVNVKHVVLENADAGERFATVLAYDVSLLYVQMFVPNQIRSSGTLERTPVYVAGESLLALVYASDMLIQGPLRK